MPRRSPPPVPLARCAAALCAAAALALLCAAPARADSTLVLDVETIRSAPVKPSVVMVLAWAYVERDHALPTARCAADAPARPCADADADPTACLCAAAAALRAYHASDARLRDAWAHNRALAEDAHRTRAALADFAEGQARWAAARPDARALAPADARALLDRAEAHFKALQDDAAHHRRAARAARLHALDALARFAHHAPRDPARAEALLLRAALELREAQAAYLDALEAYDARLEAAYAAPAPEPPAPALDCRAPLRTLHTLRDDHPDAAPAVLADALYIEAQCAEHDPSPDPCALLRAFTDRHPSSPRAHSMWHRLGECAWDEGDLEGSARALERAAQTATPHAPYAAHIAWRRAWVAASRGDHAAAHQHAAPLLAPDDHGARPHDDRAALRDDLRAMLGAFAARDPEARAAFHRAVTPHHPDPAPLWHALASALADDGALAEAIDALHTAHTLAPLHPDAPAWSARRIDWIERARQPDRAQHARDRFAADFAPSGPWWQRNADRPDARARARDLLVDVHARSALNAYHEASERRRLAQHDAARDAFARALASFEALLSLAPNHHDAPKWRAAAQHARDALRPPQPAP